MGEGHDQDGTGQWRRVSHIAPKHDLYTSYCVSHQITLQHLPMRVAG